MKHLAWLLISIYISGCELFSVREAEAPTSPVAVYQPAVSPEQLFENLKKSFSDKSPQNYMACFVDSAFSGVNFVFRPSSEEAIKLSGWEIRDEEAYFKSLVSGLKDNPLTLVLTLKGSTRTSEYHIYDYEYVISTSVTEGSSIKSFYKGLAQFKIILDSRSQWVISEWQDIKLNNIADPTWSELKGSLY